MDELSWESWLSHAAGPGSLPCWRPRSRRRTEAGLRSIMSPHSYLDCSKSQGHTRFKVKGVGKC